MFFDTTVDVGVAACHLMESLLLVDHVLKEKNVLILVFRVPAQPIDRLAQAIKSSFLSFGFPVVVGVLTPHLSGGADWFFAHEVEELTAVPAGYS